MFGQLFRRRRAVSDPAIPVTDDPVAGMVERDFVPYDCASAPPEGRVLIIAPHPDDEVIGCTAMIRHCVRHDTHLEIVILTDGVGAARRGEDLHSYAQLRQQESRDAAQTLGAPEPRFLGLPDRSLSQSDSLAETLADQISRSAADIVLAPSLHEVHPDHRATAYAAVSACSASDARHLIFYEIGVALWPNLLMDLTDDLARKQQAINCFGSQLKLQAYDRHILGLNQFRAYTLPPSVKAAEAYTVVPKTSWDDWSALYGRAPLTEHFRQSSARGG